MMNMAYQNNWMTTNQQFMEQEQVGYNSFDIYSGQNNFYMDANQHQNQWQPQLQLNVQFQGFEQQSNQPSFYAELQRPVQLTTTLCRKGRMPASESMKRQRQLRRNERERERQARLNSAFDVLRGSIPSFLAPYKEEQKLTQIETLRLAKYYISSLRNMLDECEDECDDVDERGDDDDDGDCDAVESKKPRTESYSSSDGSSC